MLVLRHHARRAGVERELLAAAVEPPRPPAQLTLTAADVATNMLHCGALAALGALRGGQCPPRYRSARGAAGAGAWAALPGAGGWPGAPDPQWVLDRECDIPSVEYTPARGAEWWAAVLRQHMQRGQPLRIAGVGRAVADADPSLLSFASPQGLSRPPWGDQRFAVGDIPYSSRFRLEEPQMMSLRDYVRALRAGRVDRTQYWFGAHAPAAETAEHGGRIAWDGGASADAAQWGALERLRGALFAALGVPPAAGGGDISAQAQVGLGPGLSGSPVHFHRQALNLNVMGAKRWVLLPPWERWSNQPIYDWWHAAPRPPAAERMQRPGDVMFVPDGVGHGVINAGPALSISWLLAQGVQSWAFSSSSSSQQQPPESHQTEL